MATMRELNRHLASVKTVGQIAGAMRTIASAKYARYKRVHAAQKEYAAMLASAQRLLDQDAFKLPDASEDAPVCYILVGSDRGFCGAYNSELAAFAETLLNGKEGPSPLLITINQSAARLAESSHLDVLAAYSCDRDPSAELCSEITDLILEKYIRGEISSVVFIKQHYVNALVQRPEAVQILPVKEEEGLREIGNVLLLPDAQTVAAELFRLSLSASVRTHLLDAVMALQAATMVAMRSAYDNSVEVSDNLTLEISRKRQASVTEGVIETASAMNAEDL